MSLSLWFPSKVWSGFFRAVWAVMLLCGLHVIKLTLLSSSLWTSLVWTSLLLGILHSDLWYSAYMAVHNAYQQNQVVCKARDSLGEWQILDKIIESPVLHEFSKCFRAWLGYLFVTQDWYLVCSQRQRFTALTQSSSVSRSVTLLLFNIWMAVQLSWEWSHKMWVAGRNGSWWGSTRWQWNCSD